MSLLLCLALQVCCITHQCTKPFSTNLSSSPKLCPVAVQGSVGLLLAAVLTQPLHPFAPALSWWGHFLGYVIGSLWFTAGACAQIADVAHETASAAAKEQCSQH